MLNRSAACQQAVAHPRDPRGRSSRCSARTATSSPTPRGATPPTSRAVRGTATRARTSRGPRASPWDDRIPYPVFAIGAHIYLQDCNRADGPTAIVPGSHRSGRLAPFDRMYDADLTYDGRPPVLIEANAGDVALFVSDVVAPRPPGHRGRARPLLPPSALRPPRHRAAHPHDRSMQPPVARSDRAGQDGTRAHAWSACTIRSSTTHEPATMAGDDEERIALFLDYENLAIGAREALGASPFDFRPIADALAERGRVVVRRAYADWSRFDEDRRELTRHHVELIEIPQRMGAIRKNAADIKMAVDAIELSLRARLHHHVRARHRRQRLHAARPQAARAEPAGDRHRHRGVDVGAAAARVRRVPVLRAARGRRAGRAEARAAARRRAGSGRRPSPSADAEAERRRPAPTSRADPAKPTSASSSRRRSPASSAARAGRCSRRC